ncbi:Nuclear pore glycoprotein p62 [Danaus plexippus plexippus]|uniref:Nuclear pore glycoprotein p62 n=1 Tax=Danaus plexippus plexippus TaxID=278856 RepID=A0A212F094_DANPL|nr:Nuclear pore glycoprotein p62 [Danaus plexippus plexippus]
MYLSVVVLIARSQAPPAAITSINFAELQENINKWSLSLEEQERVFYRQATTLNAWDRLSASNGEKTDSSVPRGVLGLYQYILPLILTSPLYGQQRRCLVLNI